MDKTFIPTLTAARTRIAAVQPAAYARTRNALGGAVTGLSPYITHGFVTLADVLAGVAAHHALDMQHKFVYELGWRGYFRHVWQHRGEGILRSVHEGLLPEDAYARELPDDIREARTGLPVVDEAVRTLYATGMLHIHARMWLASYVVHVLSSATAWPSSPLNAGTAKQPPSALPCREPAAYAVSMSLTSHHGWRAGPNARRRLRCFRLWIGAATLFQSSGAAPHAGWKRLQTCWLSMRWRHGE